MTLHSAMCNISNSCTTLIHFFFFFQIIMQIIYFIWSLRNYCVSIINTLPSLNNQIRYFYVLIKFFCSILSMIEHNLFLKKIGFPVHWWNLPLSPCPTTSAIRNPTQNPAYVWKWTQTTDLGKIPEEILYWTDWWILWCYWRQL